MNRSSSDQPQYLLDDLHAIHELLDDTPADAEPAPAEGDIPLLSDVVDTQPAALDEQPPLSLNLAELGALLSPQLRTEASFIVQQVVDEFMPQIEAEVRQRLEALLDQQRRPKQK